MKRCLFLLIASFFFNQCKIDDIDSSKVVNNFNNDIQKNLDNEDEYVVNFPDNDDSVQMRLHLEIVKGLHHISTCPCSKLLQLWGGTVRIMPDGQEPPPPPTAPGGNIVKNYAMMENDPSSKFMFPRFSIGQLNNPFNQPIEPKSEVTIAIVDSGMELSDEATQPSPFLYTNTGHPSICNSTTMREGTFGMNVLNRTGLQDASEPQDSDGHGTFINGVISGIASPPAGYTGAHDYIGSSDDVALKLLHVRFVSNRSTEAKLFDALCGVHYALNKGAKVINASWRSLVTDAGKDSLKKAFIPTLQALKKADAVLIACSGNDYIKPTTEHTPLTKYNVFPASFSRDPDYGDNVIAVGAWDLMRNEVAGFSNEGSYVDIYAPGVEITSTNLNNALYHGQSIGQGTSYATPYVSRVAAILLGNNTPITDLKKRLLRNATDLPYNQTTIKMLNHKKAVENAVQ